MKVHRNARLLPRSRALLVEAIIEEGLTWKRAAARSRSKLFAKALVALRIRHLFTKPYPPKTNGKAEPFIQTSLREWAYAASSSNSAHRALHLLPWLHRSDWHRPHCSLILPMNNLLSRHT